MKVSSAHNHPPVSSFNPPGPQRFESEQHESSEKLPARYTSDSWQLLLPEQPLPQPESPMMGDEMGARVSGDVSVPGHAAATRPRDEWKRDPVWTLTIWPVETRWLFAGRHLGSQHRTPHDVVEQAVAGVTSCTSLAGWSGWLVLPGPGCPGSSATGWRPSRPPPPVSLMPSSLPAQLR